MAWDRFETKARGALHIDRRQAHKPLLFPKHFGLHTLGAHLPGIVALAVPPSGAALMGEQTLRVRMLTWLAFDPCCIGRGSLTPCSIASGQAVV